jgi:Fe-only nitrogenase delta subunit
MTEVVERVVDELLAERTEQLVDFIMKHCLWQFHSRSWDRQRQNAEILGMTATLLCGEPVEALTPADRCYRVDAVYLVDSFRTHYPWIRDLAPGEILRLIDSLKQRLDVLTITESLNEELTDKHY